MFRVILASMLLMIVALQFTRAAADEPKAAPAAQEGDAQVGQSRIRSYPAMTYFFQTKETSYDQIPATIQELLPAVEKSIVEAKAQIVGPPLLIYHHVINDRAARVKLDVGFPVRDGAKAAGDAQVKQLEKFRCVSLLYTGPTASIHQAYEKLAANAPAHNGPLVAEESRQMLLYWEGSDSPNNVIQIMIGIGEK